MAKDNPHVEAKVPVAPPATNSPPKRYATAIAFSLFCGALGIDRFYLGYTGLGILKLVTFGGFGVWTLVDIILVLTGKLGSADGQPLVVEDGDKKFMKIMALIYLAGILVLITLAVVLAVAMASLIQARPDLFRGGASGDSRLLSADDVYSSLSVGMPQEEAQHILGDNEYISDCAKRATASGSSEVCTYWRFSWNDSDQINVSYQDGEVAEISQQSVGGGSTLSTSEEN